MGSQRSSRAEELNRINRNETTSPLAIMSLMVTLLGSAVFILGCYAGELAYVSLGVVLWICAFALYSMGRAQIRRDVRVHGLGAETKTCPACAEQVLVAATKCKHCGEALS